MENAVLVGLVSRSAETDACQRSLNELERLLKTAGGEAVFRVIQVKDTPDPATAIGKGKAAEISGLCRINGVSLAVFDFELSPSQIRNLEEIMEDVRVIDRSMLILDIFALHASSGEGKIQVELAQLQYSAPRLTGRGGALSRQGGTIGTRGPGESKLEEDKRYINKRIDSLRSELAYMEKNRATMRVARDRSGLAKVAIVGYTNAGKSTLLNYLTGAGVLSEDKLFATLDPTTRKLMLPDGETVLLTDTVGLIRKLPHHLVEAFHSTLEEAALADVLLVVSDVSDEECEEKLSTVLDTLKQLNAADKPVLYVFNKCDDLEEISLRFLPRDSRTVYVSAKDGRGIDELLEKLSQLLKEGKQKVLLRIPYEKSRELQNVYRLGTVSTVEYADDYIQVEAVLDGRGLSVFKNYLVKNVSE